jgi:uncharacterized protein YggE
MAGGAAVEVSVKTLCSLLIGLGMAISAGPSFAQTVPMEVPVVITSGEAEVKRAADRAWIGVTAESRSRDPKDAQRMNVDAMSAVMQKLKSLALGEDAIRTTAVELHPEFDYANGRQTLRGYVARNSIEVRVDEIARAGEVLTAAVGSGATSISGVRFDLKNREAVEQEALRLAVANARSRADAAAAGAGMRVERILRIQDQRAAPPEPRPVFAMRESMEAAPPMAADVPVSPGEITVRASVSLTASIR